MKILKRNELTKKLGTCSRKIASLTKNDGLPKPILIGKSMGWIESEIDAWIEQRIAERDAQGGVL